MEVLVIGSGGFLGRNVAQALVADHSVHTTSRREGATDGSTFVDLADRQSIATALERIKPEAIINCAGIVGSDQVELNVLFTKNLLEEIVASGQHPKRIVSIGSAAEYGIVSQNDIPVDKDTPLHPASPYGESKAQETATALEFREKHNLPIVVARVFNPIGRGMQPKFLIPSIIRQISEIQSGSKQVIEVNRLDAKRDYLNVNDVALGIKALIEHQPKEAVYNLGSGQSTSNAQLVNLILENSQLGITPEVVQTSDQEEPLFAIQAAINRMRNEFGWQPTYQLAETIKEIMYGE